MAPESRHGCCRPRGRTSRRGAGGSRARRTPPPGPAGRRGCGSPGKGIAAWAICRRKPIRRIVSMPRRESCSRTCRRSPPATPGSRGGAPATRSLADGGARDARARPQGGGRRRRRPVPLQTMERALGCEGHPVEPQEMPDRGGPGLVRADVDEQSLSRHGNRPSPISVRRAARLLAPTPHRVDNRGGVARQRGAAPVLWMAAVAAAAERGGARKGLRNPPAGVRVRRLITKGRPWPKVKRQVAWCRCVRAPGRRRRQRKGRRRADPLRSSYPSIARSCPRS